MTYALGVDLGTTYTAAAVWRDGRADTVALADRAHSIPSALFLREDGTMLVGDTAVRRGAADPERIAREFKRWLGDDAPLLLGDTPVTAQELTGWLLRWVIDQVSEREGGSPGHVVLTCPATWGDYRRQLMRDVAAAAQLTDVGLMPEPVAAAIYYASQRNLSPGALIAVYDLGGGTFDATVVRKTEGGFEIHGTPGGDDSIGGTDFDEVVMSHVATTIGRRWTELDPEDPIVRAGLVQVRAHAVTAKETLSSDIEATVPVILPDINRQVRITRGEFESAIRIPVLRTVDTLSRTISSAGVEPADVDAVLLVGGSSRIPLISQLIASELGVPVAVDAQPKYAVCLGAAISAASRVVATPSAPSTRQAVPSAPSSAPSAPSSAPSTPPASPPPPTEPRPPSPADPSTDGAELLVPATPAAPGAAAADFVVTDLWQPVDMLLAPQPDPSRPPPVLTREDRLTVEHTGDVRRGTRAALLASGAAALVLVTISVITLALRSHPGTDAGTVSTPPPTSVADPSPSSTSTGPAVRLRAQSVPDSPGDVMNAVAAAADGSLVAVGWSERDGVPRAWRYTSGRWSRMPGPKPGLTGQGRMTGVASGPNGLVAVGWVARRTETQPADEDRQPAIWTLPRGENDWGLLKKSAIDGDIGELSDVVAQPGGGFLAAGTDWVADPQSGDGALLQSADGSHWQRVKTTGLDGPGPVTLRRLLAGAGGEVLAVGTRLNGASSSSVLWRTPDQRAWSVVSSLNMDASTSADAWGLTRLRGGSLVISGAATAMGAQARPLVWTGKPTSLRLRTATGTGTPHALITSGGRVTAVGVRGTGATSRAVAWTVDLR